MIKKIFLIIKYAIYIYKCHYSTPELWLLVHYKSDEVAGWKCKECAIYGGLRSLWIRANKIKEGWNGEECNTDGVRFFYNMGENDYTDMLYVYKAGLEGNINLAFPVKGIK